MFFRKKADAKETATGVVPPSPEGEKVAATDANTSMMDKETQTSVANKSGFTHLGEIASLLMRSEHREQYSLADLEWLVAPAIALGQFVIAGAKLGDDGATRPAGFILWARVSDEIDHEIRSNPSATIRLKPDQWRSGDNLWITEVVGEKQALLTLRDRLVKSLPPGQTFSMRRREVDGTFSICSLPERAVMSD